MAVVFDIKKFEGYVQDLTARPALISHDFGHLNRVAVGAEWFSGNLGATEEMKKIAYIAGLIHDLSRPATEKEDHTQTSLKEAGDALDKFAFPPEGKKLVLRMVGAHRLGGETKNELLQSVFLADKLFEQMGAYVAFRRCAFVGEIEDCKAVPFREAIMQQFRARLEKFPTTSFLGKFFRIAQYQHEWPRRFYEAFSKNEPWAVAIATLSYKNGRTHAKTIEGLIEEYKPLYEEDKRYKKEAQEYIRGAKFSQFEKLVIDETKSSQ